jgi:hypothetical protein
MSEFNRMEFLSAGILVRDRMTPEMLALWRAEFRREMAERGGLTDDGKSYVKDVARAVLSEVLERATRHFANELTPRAREHMSEDDVERLELELSDILRKVLDSIAGDP